MPDAIDVYWSFRSPFSYLVTPDLARLRTDYDVDVRMRIVYPIAIRDPALVFDPANRAKAFYIMPRLPTARGVSGHAVRVPAPGPHRAGRRNHDRGEGNSPTSTVSAPLASKRSAVAKGLSSSPRQPRSSLAARMAGTRVNASRTPWRGRDWISASSMPPSRMATIWRKSSAISRRSRQRAIGACRPWCCAMSPSSARTASTRCGWRLDQYGLARS